MAEGIENVIQLETRRRLGCAYGQGYHLCRPTDPGELPGKLHPTPVGIGAMETVTRLRT